MQTNSPTPTPPPRNRRAGRMSPLPPADLPQPQTPPPQPAPQVQQTQQPTPQPSVPQPARPPAPQPAVHPAAEEAPRPLRVQQPVGPGYGQRVLPEQPSPRRVAPSAPGARSVPAGPRPQPAQSGRSPYLDEPREPRAATGRPSSSRTEKTASAEADGRRLPGWMTTTLAIVFIGVLALGTFSLVLMANLRTTEKARQRAWESLLYNFHVTAEGNGELQVTWQGQIEHYAGVYNLDPAFVTAIIRNESSFRTTAVSSVGARGLMQMMPDTAQWIAGKLNEPFDFDRLFEAETSIRYGCWYLNYLSQLFNGDTVLVCAAYHAGQGEVWSWLGDKGISPDGVTVPIERIPISQTRTYAERVTYAYGVYEKLLYSAPDAAAVSAAHGAALHGNAADR